LQLVLPQDFERGQISERCRKAHRFED
jgi:hypothetical protein